MIDAYTKGSAAGSYYSALTSGRFPIAVSLPRHDIALAQAAREAGVDAIKLHLNAYHRASGTTFGTFAQERPFFEDVAALGLPLLVMAGQQTVPTSAEMDALADMGVEAFNMYFGQMQSHMLKSRVRPMPALSNDSTKEDLVRINALPGAIIEASITRFEAYRTPLTGADRDAYRQIVAGSAHPVVVPSQKHLTDKDVCDLRADGVAGILLGVVVTGDDPETLHTAVAPIVKTIRHDVRAVD